MVRNETGKVNRGQDLKDQKQMVGKGKIRNFFCKGPVHSKALWVSVTIIRLYSTLHESRHTTKMNDVAVFQ